MPAMPMFNIGGLKVKEQEKIVLVSSSCPLSHLI